MALWPHYIEAIFLYFFVKKKNSPQIKIMAAAGLINAEIQHSESGTIL